MRRPQPAGCPSWCTSAHAEVVEDEFREHVREVWALARTEDPARLVAAVTVVRTDNVETGATSDVMLAVDVTDCLDGAEARALALALLDGTDYLEAVDR